jgi:hypothetical protein
MASCERRTWNTPLRKPWNPVIKQCLNGIDYHMELYLKTKDTRHLLQAAALREYVSNLKEWIHEKEREGKS